MSIFRVDINNTTTYCIMISVVIGQHMKLRVHTSQSIMQQNEVSTWLRSFCVQLPTAAPLRLCMLCSIVAHVVTPTFCCYPYRLPHSIHP